MNVSSTLEVDDRSGTFNPKIKMERTSQVTITKGAVNGGSIFFSACINHVDRKVARINPKSAKIVGSKKQKRAMPVNVPLKPYNPSSISEFE